VTTPLALDDGVGVVLVGEVGVHAVALGRVGREHDVVGGEDLLVGAVVADDVEDEVDGLAGEALVGLAGDLVPRQQDAASAGRWRRSAPRNAGASAQRRAGHTTMWPARRP